MMRIPDGATILFASGGTWKYRSAYTEYNPDGSFKQFHPGVTFRATRVHGGIDCPYIVMHSKQRNGKAFGRLVVKDESERTGVSEEDILKHFFTGRYKKYEGVKYVLVDKNLKDRIDTSELGLNEDKTKYGMTAKDLIPKQATA